MKNIILGSVMALAAVASLDANAASSTFCNAPNVAGNAIATASSGGSSFFLKVAFTPKCSANVYLVGNDESALLFRVGAASNKGKSNFGGSSMGGSVARVGNCAAATCVNTDADSGLTAAPSS